MPLTLPSLDLARWRRYYESCERATPFQSPEWLANLYNRHAKGTPWPLFLEHGFAPLVVERKGLFTSLRLAGADYEDVLCESGDEAPTVTELLEALEHRRGWLVANFRALREDGALLTGWDEVRDHVAAASLMRHRSHKYVELPDSWTTYEAQLGKKLAYKLRAAPGRRDKAFTSHELRRATVETLDADLDALFDLHEARWQARGETGVFTDPDDRAAFRRASHELLATQRLWLYTLWLDGRAASALFCLVDRRAVYYYIGGIATSHQKHHPGKVLIAQAIRDAIDARLSEFDFLGGGEAYKDDWANAERQLYRLVIGRGALGWLVVRGFAPIQRLAAARKARREAQRAEGWRRPEPEGDS